jgi:hypothetical protein
MQEVLETLTKLNFIAGDLVTELDGSIVQGLYTLSELSVRGLIQKLLLNLRVHQSSNVFKPGKFSSCCFLNT